MVPPGNVSIAFGILGALAAAFAGIYAARGRHWAIVRLAVMTVLLAALGSAGLPFTIWAAVVVMVIAGRWFPWLRPTNGGFRKARPTDGCGGWDNSVTEEVA